MLARRVVALGIAVCVPVLIGIWVTDAPGDPWVRWGYPPLLVFLATFAWALLSPGRWARNVALVALVGLEAWWLAVAVGRVAEQPDASRAWVALLPTPLLDIVICLVVGFLFQRPRTAVRHGGLYALVVTGVLIAAFAAKPGGGLYVWLSLRFGVYLGVFVVLLLVLSRARERVATALADVEAADAAASAMREMAYRDELTGLANRRRLIEELWFQADQVGPELPVSVIFFDLDHFKAVNDGLGHAVGDRVLQVVAEVAGQVVGPDDLLARLGGEEFVVVAPGRDRTSAAELAQQLRERLPDAVAAAVGQRVTASYGVAGLTAAENPADVLRRIDALMYRAKAAGRDRVESAEA